MEFLKRIAGRWGPLLAILGVGSGSYLEVRMALRDTQRDLAETQERLVRLIDLDQRRHHFGPDGFRDPESRAGFEASVRNYLEARGCHCGDFWNAFFQLNPNLVKPLGGR
jgi:hypothetical protein